LKVTVDFPPEQVVALKPIVDRLIDINAFQELHYDAFLALESLVRSISLEEERQRNMKNCLTDERVCKCGHTVKFHSPLGDRVCCTVDCACMYLEFDQ
jgi:hypothetical protein